VTDLSTRAECDRELPADLDPELRYLTLNFAAALDDVAGALTRALHGEPLTAEIEVRVALLQARADAAMARVEELTRAPMAVCAMVSREARHLRALIASVEGGSDG
jgi:hypothetical protein